MRPSLVLLDRAIQRAKAYGARPVGVVVGHDAERTIIAALNDTRFADEAEVLHLTRLFGLPILPCTTGTAFHLAIDFPEPANG